MAEDAISIQSTTSPPSEYCTVISLLIIEEPDLLGSLGLPKKDLEKRHKSQFAWILLTEKSKRKNLKANSDNSKERRQ